MIHFPQINKLLKVEEMAFYTEQMTHTERVLTGFILDTARYDYYANTEDSGTTLRAGAGQKIQRTRVL